MKRVLIIAYYWPPSGGGGVQRWLKFTRYLPEFGWQPIVYTPENANYPDIDPSLEAEVNPDVQVIRYPIWEPYALYQKFQGKKKDEQVNPGFFEDRQKQSVTKKLSIWIRGNLFIPDARKFWIKPSVKFLVNYLKEHPVDVIVSTGTPHSMHVIGQKVHQKTGIPWVADFRDPWTGIEFYDQLMLTSWADRKHRQLEKSVVQGADALTTVSWHWAEDFQKMGAKHVKVLTNGFDEANFQHEPPPKFPQFTLAHLGTFAGDRNPETLWKVLAELRNSSPDFKKDFRLLLAGKTDADIFRALDQYGLLEVTEDKGYLPHEEAIKL
ncbi:MAG: glycosyltransferase, partial [Bacteroidota bacterium]